MALRVWIADKMSAKAAERLRAHGIEPIVAVGVSDEEKLKLAAEVDAILVRSATKITAEMIARAKRLKAVGRAGIGVDN
ncbi:MAG: phosphoglycerate dehydrogenase, partial [Zetaproteobacteria bacterium]